MNDDVSPFDRTRDFAVSRRGFGAGVLSAGVLGAAVSTAALAADVTESDVVIATADGPCDAAVFHPAGAGRWPGVIIFADALGLRPAFREMGRRLAAEGYVVLVPNPFFRTRKAPVLSGPFDFAKAEDRAKLTELMAPLTPEVKMRDAGAYVAYLDGLPVVKTAAKLGVVGFCMGGPYVVTAAASYPERIGAGVSLHGGNLVTDRPDSPHLMAGRITAGMYFGIATNDDERQPDAKDKLRAAFAGAAHPAKIEVYAGCMHGWCVSDGMVFNKAQADRAYGETVGLYRALLA